MDELDVQRAIIASKLYMAFVTGDKQFTAGIEGKAFELMQLAASFRWEARER